MKFAIITHVEHKLLKDKWYAYEPYVREMNLWLKYVDDIQIVAPVGTTAILKIDSNYNHNQLKLKKIPAFDITSFQNVFKAVFIIPIVLIRTFKTMQWADHIHLRCPGNVGLLGCFVQILFPNKPKTIKYAGNWDPESKQPLSYKIQNWLLSNIFLTRNAKVLVYGEWSNQSENILPFFTASYSKNEIISIEKEANFSKTIHFLFVGTLSPGKQPFLSVKVVHQLLQKGYNVKLHIYGEGSEKSKIENYILKNKLQEKVILYGNSEKEVIKEAYIKSHFLLFFSKSEGWPKVVAEAMFWGCLPITTKVSCIPYMLAEGKRGAIVSNDLNEIINTVKYYISNNEIYQQQINKAMKWSRQFTLDKFDEEIKKLL